MKKQDKEEEEQEEIQGEEDTGEHELDIEDQTERKWDWEVSDQQDEIERWHRQVHGWDKVQAVPVSQSMLEGEEWLKEDDGEGRIGLQELVRKEDRRWEGRQKKLEEYWR